MLTSLDFLNIGQPWPPESEKQRLEMYAKNRQIFENEHAEVYKEAFKRIERVIGNFENVISYPVIVNFQKLISMKVADLLFGESPKITCGDEDSLEQKTVDQIRENSDLINIAYQACIDVSRYGDGLFLVYKGEQSGIIDVTQPPIWFPVVNPDNIKRIQYHVLAWTYEKQEGQRKNIYLKVQIHEKGKYREREHAIINGKIGPLTVAERSVQTGLSDFAVIQIPNTITSDRVTGIDDYTDVDSIVSELLVRVGQISRVLDKHASPSVTGPIGAVEKDPKTGEWHLKMGNYFPRDSNEEPEVKYIVWDAQMEANFKQIEKLINFLAVISEMGPMIFAMSSDQIGNIPSGTALRRMMFSALAKVNRIRMRFDPALKKAIKLCSQLGGKNIIDLTGKQISITWQDGLPGDPLEESQIIANRTGQKATMSVKTALKRFDGMSDADAEAEIELIDEDETKVNPFQTTTFSNEPSAAGE